MTTFTAKFKDLVNKAKLVYVDGRIVCNVNQPGDYGFSGCIEITDDDPDYAERMYLDINQEVRVNENGVAQICVMDEDAAEPEDLDEPMPTKEATAEFIMHRPITQEDLS
jgi:hypothetical protein